MKSNEEQRPSHDYLPMHKSQLARLTMGSEKKQSQPVQNDKRIQNTQGRGVYNKFGITEKNKGDKIQFKACKQIKATVNHNQTEKAP